MPTQGRLVGKLSGTQGIRLLFKQEPEPESEPGARSTELELEPGSLAGASFCGSDCTDTLTGWKAHPSNYHGTDVVKGEYQSNGNMLVEYS